MPDKTLAYTIITIFAIVSVVTIILVIASVIFWVWMSVDCILRRVGTFGNKLSQDPAKDKWLWLIVVLLLPFFGGVAYFIAVKRRFVLQVNP